MIIEFINLEDKRICFVHHPADADLTKVAEVATKLRRSLPDHSVINVPGGQPNNTGNTLKMAVFNSGNHLLNQTIQKITKGKPGQWVPLLDCEMKELQTAIKKKEVRFL